MSGRDEIEWAPRLPREKIRRLYQSDAQGMLDEELLDDVGTRLYQRCLSILEVDAAKNGRVHCPRCRKAGRETVIPRELQHGAREATLTCPVCGWQVTWYDYMRTYKRHQLNLGGAADAFEGFVRDWSRSRTPELKMLAVDQLLHAFHYSFPQFPYLPSRPAGVNLINGKLPDVIRFLDELSYGPGSTPGVSSGRDDWQKTLSIYHSEYLGKMCRGKKDELTGLDIEPDI